MRINTLIVALVALIGLGGTGEKANAQFVLSIGIAPPALPVYVQPAIPEPGYIWTPGYWAWNEDISEYYWVPGAWVLPPRPGLLWTPGYWGWSGGSYVWNAGYWGPTVGFYGGVCYGFGYTGVGFAGGYWSGSSFYYNRSVTNISNTTVINNVYNQQVVNNHTTNVSYNGPYGGLQAQPTQQELQAAKEQHIAPTHEQQNHQQLASQNKDLRASVNHGSPAIAAVGRLAISVAQCSRRTGSRRPCQASLAYDWRRAKWRSPRWPKQCSAGRQEPDGNWECYGRENPC